MGPIFKHREKIVEVIAFLALILFAYLLTIKSGERGFFPFDQSIVFDGGYRILQGQVPYKDFLIPFGPIVFWLQALFFKLLGVNYFAYLVHAALANVLATICSVLLLRILFPSQKLLSFIGGLLTAVWFYPIFGTPWFEQTAFLFSLLSLLGITAAAFLPDLTPTKTNLLHFLAGVCALLDFLSKQNAGLYIIPVYFILILTAHLPNIKSIFRNTVVFTLGFGVALLLFALWLITFSDLDNFYQHFYVIPSNLGLGRLQLNPYNLLKSFLRNARPLSLRLLLITVLPTAIVLVLRYLAARRRGYDPDRPEFYAAVLAAGLISLQDFFSATSRNELENGLPFTGVIVAIAIFLVYTAAIRLISHLDLNNAFRRIILALVVLASITLVLDFSIYGLRFAFNRSVHGVFELQRHPPKLSIDKLEDLRWLTTDYGGRITEQDLRDLIAYLKSSNTNFFVFPDFTLLYALLDAPSPQPLLWFHQNLTYPFDYDADLDQWVIDDLIQNEVGIVVLEQQSFSGTNERLNHFPRLESFIDQEFDRVATIGNFLILERTSP